MRLVTPQGVGGGHGLSWSRLKSVYSHCLGDVSKYLFGATLLDEFSWTHFCLPNSRLILEIRPQSVVNPSSVLLSLFCARRLRAGTSRPMPMVFVGAGVGAREARNLETPVRWRWFVCEVPWHLRSEIYESQTERNIWVPNGAKHTGPERSETYGSQTERNLGIYELMERNIGVPNGAK